MSARMLLLLAAGTIALGCTGASSDDSSARGNALARTEPATKPTTKMITLTGTLEGGMMAIGGETTGWSLVGDGAVGGVELDVAKVEKEAKRLDGQRVTVSGKMVDKEYVERGKVRMMQVETIKPASK